ncbi:MAG: chorismate mutase [Anaerolineales bacterium]|nr:chorismate mutase [Anaerolineales bacterium]
MAVRGIRGATTVVADHPELILEATVELLTAIQAENPSLQLEDIGSVIFSLTEDLNSVFPAQAARQMGWGEVPLFCTREIPVPDSLLKCIRVLVHWNTELTQKDIKHVYLRDAVRLRPDFASAKFGGESC